MKVLFLYTELAEYFLKNCEVLSKQAEIHIVRWPVNKEAPFQFEIPPSIKVYSKSEFDGRALKPLVEKLNPDVIVCSGWIDKDYLKVCKTYYKKIPTVLTCDTHWKGSLKQILAVIVSRFTLLKIFSHAWVPGEIQNKYVQKLGFKPEKVHKGFYVCDLERFNGIYSLRSEKKASLKKRFIYIGRYYKFKGLPELWQAFNDLHSEIENEWELWCLGTGSLEGFKHNKIKHLGFVQPKDLAPILAETSVFILPSRFEPWAVVVQEMAAAGFPLVLSEAVGAAEKFLVNEQNGFLFETTNKNSLKEQLKKVILLNDHERVKMSEISHANAQTINAEMWTKTIMNIYNENKH